MKTVYLITVVTYLKRLLSLTEHKTTSFDFEKYIITAMEIRKDNKFFNETSRNLFKKQKYSSKPSAK